MWAPWGNHVGPQGKSRGTRGGLKVEAVQGKLVSLAWTEHLGNSGNGGTTLEFLSPFLWHLFPVHSVEVGGFLVQTQWR